MARLPTNNTIAAKIPITYEILIGSVVNTVTVISDVRVVKDVDVVVISLLVRLSFIVPGNGYLF